MVDNPQLTRDHHVARHCSILLMNETRTEVSPTAFEPSADNLEISVNWLEYHSGEDAARIGAVCQDLINSPRVLKAVHKLAILKVADAEDIGASVNVDVVVRHTRMDSNPSHSDIKGVPPKARILHRKLADKASERLVSVVLPK